MSERKYELPTLDAEIALEEAEDLANFQADVAAGKVDTISWDDLPEDNTYPCTITDAGVRTKKNRSGDVQYPNLFFKLQGPDFTTTMYWPVSSGKASGRKFLTSRILSTFMRLLGKSFSEADAPDASATDPSEILAEKCAYYDKLASMSIGKSVNLRVSRNEEGYNQGTLSPRH